MLVLTRKRLESVVVGGVGGFERSLIVTVLEVCGGKVKLGFEADADIPIRRSEVPHRARDGGISAGWARECVARIES